MPLDFLSANLARQNIIIGIREFFAQQDFQEITVPLLWESVPLEPTIYPFATQWQVNKRPKNLFLPISPEKSMKQYLAHGAQKCFTISHCFRNLEGISNSHHPEFLMLEWYRPDTDYSQIMTDTKDLIVYLSQKLHQRTTIAYQTKKFNLSHWQTLSLEDLWLAKWQTSLADLQNHSALATFAQKLGYQVENSTWEQLFNQIMLNEIEVDFPLEPFFLLDFPAQLSPLCALSQKRPWCAQRFEAYINHLEIGNGNSEMLDAQAIRQAFTKQFQLRHQVNQIVQPIDEKFLQAIVKMQQNGQTFAGMGLGVDRLTMILNDIADISVLWPKLN